MISTTECQGYLCGEGALCIVTNRGPTCKCPPGQYGNPFPGGSCATDQCSANQPCTAPQACISGRCKHRCEGVVCGIGANCDVNSGKCVCEPSFIGNPDLLCMPPAVNPECHPRCGDNAHCEYGFGTNQCVCNAGTTGNPYEGCGAQKKTKCQPNSCGIAAECREGFNQIDCTCPSGYNGNPFIQCFDIDECSSLACGQGAVCINTPGSYDCRCKAGHYGNPFSMCAKAQLDYCDDPLRCSCSSQLNCPVGYACDGGRCKDLCDRVQCGPRAACDSGKCVCPPGYSGNPKDMINGCAVLGQCTNDEKCNNKEICFPFGRGVRKCVNACSKIQCGPNALCVSNNHRSSCICAEGFFGNPSDLSSGCKPEARQPVGDCQTDQDCASIQICGVDATTGFRTCVDPCSTVACGEHEVCKLDAHNNPVCDCRSDFVWNAESSRCEKPTLPECKSDNDCHQVAACRPDILGVPKCVAVCLEFTCPSNSVCVAQNHQGSCHCLSGYSGNPNDRNGCRAELRSECSTHAECPESEACVRHEGVMRCRPACDEVKCGPHAICITNNHNAQCQCPPGPFAGDPYDKTNGCRSVPCVYNIDCPATQLCNRLTHTCYDVCDEESCGENAVCIADDHRAVCQCPSGYRPNPLPEVECIALDGCEQSPCHSSAICESGPNGHVCKCAANQIGDPYTSGCRSKGVCPGGDKDCPENSACLNGRCVNPCESACGPNALCEVIGRKPVCSCPLRFEAAFGGMRNGCVRQNRICHTDLDCGGDVCNQGQCRAACRNNKDCVAGEKCTQSMCVNPCSDHSQCLTNQACNNGFCSAGCRSNKDCDSESACLNSKCQNPCEIEGTCGPNSLCRTADHVPTCTCPAGFEGNPVPQQGCVRVPAICTATNQCPAAHMCIGNQCSLPCRDTNSCAVGERCYNEVCVKVCYTNNNCLPGEVCNHDGVCQVGCQSDQDCPATKVCLDKNCKCSTGFIGTPYGCSDIDECSQNPCHPTAACENTPGSFKCVCPSGTVPGSEGCVLPNQCQKHADCASTLSCENGKCKNPCESIQCGRNALCAVSNHKAMCQCPEGHLGDARDAQVGCFRVECLSRNDCGPFRNCHEETNKCINPCEYANCGRGNCAVADHEAICTCFAGYELINGKCEDVNECQASPCHETAVCANTIGSYQCACPPGLVGEPVLGGCRGPEECYTDADCPSSAACISAKCQSPCAQQNTCGRNAECIATDHRATCRCASNARGDPHVECVKVECSDNDDCPLTKTCLDAVCVNPCTLANVCGQNSECVNENHQAVCSCRAGTTGNPLLGCVPVQYCSSDQQCPSGTVCNAGVCCSVCTTNRDCFGDQLCIQGVCQPTCRSNSSCPDFQYCYNNICTQEFVCRKNEDCDIDEVCVVDSTGRSQCQTACSGRNLCGRNAECSSRNHQAECDCKPGFAGDALTGCRRIECQVDDDCSQDKTCQKNMCKVACLVGDGCGQNALCSAENHKSMCYCKPGFTGDANIGCEAINYCREGPCGPGALCKNSRGSYRCDCPNGGKLWHWPPLSYDLSLLNYFLPTGVGDPYGEGCRAAVECARNDDCPTNAKCSLVRGVPKCKDVCETVRCGPNAECRPKGHVAECECHGGYDGHANDLTVGCRPLPTPCRSTQDCPQNTYCHGSVCKATCVLDSECNLDEVCFNGQCLNPCDQPQACGMNAECSISGNVKHCSCPAGFTGSASQECVRSKFTARFA